MRHRGEASVGGEFGGRAERSEVTAGDRDEFGSASGSYAGHGFENACVPMLPEDTGDLFVQIGDLPGEQDQRTGCLLNQD